MEYKKFDVESFYEAPLCKCGGFFKDRTASKLRLIDDGVSYEAEYQCIKCKKTVWLKENEVPGVKYSIKFRFNEEGNLIDG